jgi:hypothetical protein
VTSKCCCGAGWTAAETTRLQTTFGFGLLFARVAVGYVIDHIFAPRVLTTVSIGGALACVLYALYPDAGYVSALLIGFLLGAEFDVLAFLIKRYYGNVAYGRIYGVIFALFYLGSGFGIWALPNCGAIGRFSYDNGLYAAADPVRVGDSRQRSCRSTATPPAHGECPRLPPNEPKPEPSVTVIRLAHLAAARRAPVSTSRPTATLGRDGRDVPEPERRVAVGAAR